MKYIACLSIVLSVLYAGCRTADTVSGPVTPQPGVGIFVFSEGAYPNPGTIGFYNTSTDTILRTIVGSSKGWVTINDGKVIGRRVYVAVTGNDTVQVIDAETFQTIGGIGLPAFTGPGFVAGDTTMIFTANYNGSVSLIDPATISLVRSSTPQVSFPGGILYANGRVFLSDFGTYLPPTYVFVPGTSVLVLDPVTLALDTSIRVSDAPGSMAQADGKVFVLCSGSSSSLPKIYQIHPGTFVLEDSLVLSGYLTDLATDGHSLFVLGRDSVAKIELHPLRIGQRPFITLSSGDYFYAMNVDVISGDVCVSTVLSSGGPGAIEIYSSDGTSKRGPIPAGVFPGAFAFRR